MICVEMSKTENLINIMTFILISLKCYSVISIDSSVVANESSLEYEDNKWYWNKEEYPNPYTDPPYCRRTKPSFVCDPDQVLTRKEANRLDDLIKSLRNVSNCFCPYCPPNDRGISFGIAIMKNIYKEYNNKQLENADNFADFIRKKWNFGVCDNNVVFILIKDDNQVAFAQGSIASKVFPPEMIGNFIVEHRIHFIQEKYFEGFERILSSILMSLRKIQYSEPFKEIEEKDEEPKSDDSSHTGLIVGLIIGFILFVLFIIFLLIYLKRRFSEDMNNFQFKGMLSKGYWLNKNERLRPVSVSPINRVGGVYEPCSIEENNDSEADKRLRQKLSQISDESTTSDEENIHVIEHKSETPTQSISANTSVGTSIGRQTPQDKHIELSSNQSKGDVNDVNV